MGLKEKKQLIKYLKLIYLTIFICLLVSIILLSISLGPIIKNKKNYEAITKYMNDGLYSSYQLDDIEQIIKNIPEDYENISNIKREFFEIKSDLKNILQSNIDLLRDESFPNRMRISFINLKRKMNSIEYWNVQKYLKDSYILFLIFNLKFTTENNSYYFKLGGNYNAIKIDSDFPNRWSDNNNYKGYYYSDYDNGDVLVFRYVNKNNDSYVYDVYRISQFGIDDRNRFHIKIYVKSLRREFIMYY